MIHQMYLIITMQSILVKDSSNIQNTTNEYFQNMLANDLATSMERLLSGPSGKYKFCQEEILFYL